jgi:phospholipid/cholesterol/gamma-HCH transport system permease protein
MISAAFSRSLMPIGSTVQPETKAHVELHAGAEGHCSVALRGRLDATSTADAWDQLEKQLAERGKVSSLEIDVSNLEYCDGSGMALLSYLNSGQMTPGARVTLRGLKPEFEKLFASFPVEEALSRTQPQEPKRHIAEDAGAGARAVWRDLREQIIFTGQVSKAFATALFRPKQMRWTEVKRVFEAAGANALPIVSLISLLVGLVIAFESASPLRQFGAQVFIANMIGLVMIRELGPIMTAILLAGRSGSSFAAEIGTMKVNEELNALETMGLDPVRFLVIQRITAGVLLMPVLTAYSMLAGVLGGVVVMRVMGFPLSIIYDQMAQSVQVRDIVFGEIKAVAFGLIVASIGCLRGLQTKKGPIAVGESTTRAVVSGILLIIITDAMFSVLYFVLFP